MRCHECRYHSIKSENLTPWGPRVSLDKCQLNWPGTRATGCEYGQPTLRVRIREFFKGKKLNQQDRDYLNMNPYR